MIMLSSTTGFSIILTVISIAFVVDTTTGFTATRASYVRSFDRRHKVPSSSLSLHAAINSSPRQHQRLVSAIAFGNPPKVVHKDTTTTLAGKLVPFLSKFALTPSKLQEITKAANSAIDIREFLFISFIGWAMLPFVQYVIAQYNNNRDDAVDATTKTSSSTSSTTPSFEKSLTFKVMDTISKLSKLGAIIYLLDVIGILLTSLGFPLLQHMKISNKFGKIAILYWIMLKLKRYKLSFWKRTFGSTYRENSIGRAEKFNRLSNIVLYFLFLVVSLEQLQLNNFGIALQSVFAFGGVGTLIFSLASKDIATQLVSGLALSAAAPFFVGDDVQFGNGIKGKIVKIGWLSTWIRGSDELITKVPNQQIANQQQANISRVKLCQVTQKLRFSYDNIDDLPSLIEDMKDEIDRNCPTLITDGSRPFRVHWRNYEEDHLEVIVDCHFEQPPVGDGYFDNRQNVLEAIATTVKRKGMKFAIPTSITQNMDISVDDTSGNKVQEGKGATKGAYDDGEDFDGLDSAF